MVTQVVHRWTDLYASPHKFAQKLIKATQKPRVGHDSDSSTTVGAITAPQGIEKLERHVADASPKGATSYGNPQPNPPFSNLLFE